LDDLPILQFKSAGYTTKDFVLVIILNPLGVEPFVSAISCTDELEVNTMKRWNLILLASSVLLP
jgi:hypothetical protein